MRMHARPWEARCHAALGAVYAALGEEALASKHHEAGRDLGIELGMGDVFLLPKAPRPATARRSPGVTERAVTFRQTDGGWLVEHGEVTCTLGATSGLAMVHLLVNQPGTDVHATQLYAHANDVPAVTSASAGPVLDAVAVRQYRDRHAQLLHEHQEAIDNHDPERSTMLQTEIDAIEDQLVGAFGLGQRRRQLDDPADRARVNVRRSIVRALDAIAKHDSWLADHLRAQISTGRFCRYDSDPHAPVAWTTATP
jgi:non-specific serine/threonine protein kinase